MFLAKISFCYVAGPTDYVSIQVDGLKRQMEKKQDLLSLHFPKCAFFIRDNDLFFFFTWQWFPPSAWIQLFCTHASEWGLYEGEPYLAYSRKGGLKPQRVCKMDEPQS